ncbi:TPM domain-containing protein [Pleurocapsa sp. PCC 7319]|uniref:TPM domain-containing protein n=1 Tax=Pleurocapsa sp. PCC 7319 TaxID=118161 RepID=UPI0003480302|nr:TPM domain-containing protein [Pleurocapsa sp. PCC 7319]
MSSVIQTKNKIIFVITLCLSLVLFPLVSYGISVTQVPNPKVVNNTWVTDMANILSDRTEIQINQMIDGLEQKNGTEIAVVTVPETQPAASPKEFTTELFNSWGIGKAGQDNGVLFLVSVGDRRVEIETGYGVEGILPDAKVGNIIQTEITPRFKQQDFDGGVLNGTNALVKVLSGEDFASIPITSSNTFNQIAVPYNLNYVFLILGIIGSSYCYKCVLKKVSPVYLEPIGYSRNKYFTEPPKEWLIYNFVYVGCTLGIILVIAPILASISRELLVAALVGLHIYWIKKIIQNPPSIENIVSVIMSPILLIAASLLTYIGGFIGFVITIVLSSVYLQFEHKKVTFFTLLGIVINYILIMLPVGIILSSLNNPGHIPVILLGLIGSIPLTYLVWEYLKQEFNIDGKSRVYCATCQGSLKQIDIPLLRKYLKPKEIVAAKIGSVNFQGWRCDECNSQNESAIHICADAVGSSKFSECPTCQELTVIRKTEILKQATTRKSGMRLHKYDCQCCDYTHEKEEIIPRKSSSSSSVSSSNYSGGYSSGGSSGSSGSSSGGGSFGGGDSGGGGAGGSW